MLSVNLKNKYYSNKGREKGVNETDKLMSRSGRARKESVRTFTLIIKSRNPKNLGFKLCLWRCNH